MQRTHEYKTEINWTGNRGSGTMDYRSYERDFTISSDNKPILKGSSGSSFNGNKNAYSPEDLLVAAVSSCHMLWYLHLCAEHNVVVLEYKDQANGTLQEESNGSGSFTSINLMPIITINEESNQEIAEKLHQEAHNMCFIANSLKCTVNISPTFKKG